MPQNDSRGETLALERAGLSVSDGHNIAAVGGAPGGPPQGCPAALWNVAPQTPPRGAGRHGPVGQAGGPRPSELPPFLGGRAGCGGLPRACPRSWGRLGWEGGSPDRNTGPFAPRDPCRTHAPAPGLTRRRTQQALSCPGDGRGTLPWLCPSAPQTPVSPGAGSPHGLSILGPAPTPRPSFPQHRAEVGAEWLAWRRAPPDPSQEGFAAGWVAVKPKPRA